ncbi:Tetraspanin [Mactra antiquata]
MGAVSKYGTTFVIMINSLFGVIGLFFLIAGALVKFAPQYIDKYSGTLIDTVKKEVPEDVASHLEDFKLSEFVGAAATCFLVFGGVLTAIVMWAYCGTCCNSKWMLTVYAALMTALILGEIAVVVLFTTNRELIDDKLKKPLQESLKNFYEGSNSQSAISLAWNALMGLLHCCGVDGPEDFSTTNAWNSSNEFSDTTLPPPVFMEAPLVCLTDKENATNTLSATGNFTSAMYMQTGCYDALWSLVEENQTIAIAIFSGFGALQIILWLLTVCMISEMGGKKVKPSPS